MNLHKNARTCPKSRALVAQRVLVEGWRVVDVARAFGISPRTVYKWIERCCEGGEAALGEGSSIPVQRPHQLGQDWVDLMVELRTEYGLTALRIARQLSLARSTVALTMTASRSPGRRDWRSRYAMRRSGARGTGQAPPGPSFIILRVSSRMASSTDRL